MSIFKIETVSDSSKLGIWKIQERYADLFESVGQMGFDLSLMSSFKSELKRKQWLAARMMLHQMEPDIKKIHYQKSGAPYLENGHFISLSHSNDMVAVYLDKVHDVGVDIQHDSEKIMNIRKKFLSPFEMNYLNQDGSRRTYLVAWSAKEAIYKKMKMAGLIFNSEIEIEPFEIETKGTLKAKVTHGEQALNLSLKYEILEDYALVYTSIP